MKKYILFLFILLVFILNINYSYSYIDCSNKIIKPHEVSTLNLKNYLKSKNINNLNYLCSYKYCYNIKEDNISESITNFTLILNSKASDYEKEITYVKGYPITSISFNNCK